MQNIWCPGLGPVKRRLFGMTGGGGAGAVGVAGNVGRHRGLPHAGEFCSAILAGKRGIKRKKGKGKTSYWSEGMLFHAKLSWNSYTAQPLEGEALL